jgi:hypothetical protein
MSTSLMEKISMIPKEKEKEVEEFLDNILGQIKTQEVKATGKRGGFGALKGMFIMSDDFDEPLEDFKDYM